MAQKFFTIEEANSLIPHLEASFDKILGMQDVLNSANMDIKDLFDIWGNDLLDSKNLDNFLYLERMRKKDMMMGTMKNEVAQIQALGIEIKDIKNGLVDFLHDSNGKTVFLCWRRGESCIQYWHPIESGFSGRRRIEELGMLRL